MERMKINIAGTKYNAVNKDILSSLFPLSSFFLLFSFLFFFLLFFLFAYLSCSFFLAAVSSFLAFSL